MKVFKINLSYNYYGLEIAKDSYMIIAHNCEGAIQNGIQLGTVIDDIEPSEIESCDADYSSFLFCQTWLFQNFLQPLDLASAQAAIAAAREALRIELANEMEEFYDVIARLRAIAEAENVGIPPELHAALKKFTVGVSAMRKAQKAKQYNVKLFEVNVDSLIPPFERILASIKQE